MRLEDMSEIQANSAGHTRVSCSVYLVSKYLIKNYTLAYFFFCESESATICVSLIIDLFSGTLVSAQSHNNLW